MENTSLRVAIFILCKDDPYRRWLGLLVEIYLRSESWMFSGKKSEIPKINVRVLSGMSMLCELMKAKYLSHVLTSVTLCFIQHWFLLKRPYFLSLSNRPSGLHVNSKLLVIHDFAGLRGEVPKVQHVAVSEKWWLISYQVTEVWGNG